MDGAFPATPKLIFEVKKMSWKTIFIIIATVFGIFAAFYLIGIIFSWLSYIFWIAVIGAIGYGGYRLFKAATAKELESKEPVYQLDFDDSTKLLEEYRQKYLEK